MGKVHRQEVFIRPNDSGRATGKRLFVDEVLDKVSDRIKFTKDDIK